MRLIQLIKAQSNSLGHAHMEEFHTQKNINIDYRTESNLFIKFEAYGETC